MRTISDSFTLKLRRTSGLTAGAVFLLSTSPHAYDTHFKIIYCYIFHEDFVTNQLYMVVFFTVDLIITNY